MKKYKFVIIFSLGLILIICGLSFNGKNQIHKIVPIQEIQDINFKVDSSSQENYVYDDIKEIKINVISAKIKIIEQDRNDIAIKLLNDDLCKIENNDGCLEIEQDHYWSNDSHILSVVIEIPYHYQFDSTEIEVGFGQLIISSLNTTDLNAEVGAGELIVSNLKVEENMDISCGMGNVEMTLIDTLSSFGYDIECGMGNVTIGEDSYSGVAQSRIFNKDSNSFINIDCGMGNVEVKED